MRSLRLWVQQVTRTQLDQVAGQTEFDLVTALATPLPVIVIAEMLGVESDRQADFKR